MSSPPTADATRLDGPPDATLGCLSLAVPASFHRAWPSDGDVVPADFGVVWAMAGVDWRIEMDLDGAPLDSGPIPTGAWQSFALSSSLSPGSAHGLQRRIFDGDSLVYSDEIDFTVGELPAAAPATPSVAGLAMVEDHPQPCDWEPLSGSACEADLQRHGCANPIESFPSYTMAADPNTLLYVVTSSETGTSEVSAAECPALREVVAWNCPESTCVTITAVGRDGRLGASVEHCDDADAWVRDDGGDGGESGGGTTEGASSTGEPDASSNAGGCSVERTTATEFSVAIGLVLILCSRLDRPRTRVDRSHEHPR